MQLITDNTSLREAMNELNKEQIVAVDTEFKRQTSYFPKTCLIQIAARNQKPYIIDVLAYNLNLFPVFNLLQNDKIIKVFHDASQDIEAIYHNYGITPQNVFDTQIAASLAKVGSELSYSNLVFKLIGVNLNKEQQFTNWEHRPLSESQLEYAAKDVEHLIAIYDKLNLLLRKFKGIEWHNAIVNNLMPSKDQESKKWFRIFNRLKTKKYSEVEVAIVYGLIKIREEYAKKNNIIREKVLNHAEIKNIRRKKPTTIKEVKKCKESYNTFLKLDVFCQDIIDVVANAYQENNEFIKLNKIRLSEEYRHLFHYITINLNEKAKQLGVSPGLVVKKEDIDSYIIDRITKNNPDLNFLKQLSFDKVAKKVLDNLVNEE